MHKFFTKDYTIYEKRPEGEGCALCRVAHNAPYTWHTAHNARLRG